jgi:uncharacterized GH25 family protein
MNMIYKKASVTISIVFIICLTTIAHDYYLLPEGFFLHRGEMLKVHLIVGDDFKPEFERRYQSTKTERLLLHAGKQVADLRKSIKDSAAYIDSRVYIKGLALLEMTRNYSSIELGRDQFLAYLKEEGIAGIAEKVDNGTKQSFKEKYTRYLKTLVCVDGNYGGVYQEELQHDLEIILKDNPYETRVGSDLAAIIKFKRMPLAGVTMDVLVKDASGKIHLQRVVSDKDGKVNFKLSRKGVYLLRLVHMVPSGTPDADFESFWASYTFAK